MLTVLWQYRLWYLGQVFWVGFLMGSLLGVVFLGVESDSWLSKGIEYGLEGMFVTVCWFLIEVFWLDFYFKRMWLPLLLLARSTMVMGLIFMAQLIISGFFIAHQQDIGWGEGVSYLLKNEQAAQQFLAMFYIALVVIVGNEMIRFAGRQNILYTFLGKYSEPVEEERVFMYVSLIDIENLAFTPDQVAVCALLQDFCYDIDEALRYTGGEIREIVGDSIVISWVLKGAKQNMKVLDSVLLMEELIEQHQIPYLQKYGFVPSVKAGLHSGKVYSVWAGYNHKRLIHYENVTRLAAKIQSVCKIHHASLLISERFYDQFIASPQFSFVKLPPITFQQGNLQKLTILKVVKNTYSHTPK